MHISLSTSQSPIPRAGRSTKWLIILLLVLQACFCWKVRGRCLAGATDMRAFYGAGMMVRQGQVSRIYDDLAEESTQQAVFKDQGRTLHFLYPAFAALVFVPLTFLSYPAAFVIFLLLGCLCIFSTTYLLVGESSTRVRFACYLQMLVLCCFPAAIALVQGQITFFLLLLFTIAYKLEREGRTTLAGLILSLAVVKFQFVLPVILLCLMWKKFNLVRGFVSGALALAVLTFAITGEQGVKAYLLRLQRLGHATLLNPADAHLRYGMQTSSEPNLHGLIVMLAGSGPISIGLTVILSLTVIAWSSRQRPSLITALPAALLVSYHMQPYDLTLLCLPLIVLSIERPFNNTTPFRERLFRLSGIGLLAFPAAPLMLTTSYGSLLALASFITLLSSARSSGLVADDMSTTLAHQDSTEAFVQQPCASAV